MKPAGMAARATAVIIDSVLLFFGLGIAVAIFTGQAHSADGNIGFNLHGWPFFVWLVLALGYFAVCEHVWGRTIGKRLFSIRVTGDDDAEVTWRCAILRNLLRPVDAVPFFPPYLLGFIVAMTSGERQRIGDRVGGTRVVADGEAPEPPDPSRGGDTEPDGAGGGYAGGNTPPD